jgi:hypothetical protein
MNLGVLHLILHSFKSKLKRALFMKMLKTNLFRSLLLVVLLPFGVMSQNFSGHNWYFGNSPQGIRFSRSDNSAPGVVLLPVIN